MVVLVSVAIGAVNVAINSEVKQSKEDEGAADRIEFCKSVRDTISKDDKVCGPYLAQIDKAIEEDKAAAEREAEQRQLEAAAAANPYRTISLAEMWNCKAALKNTLKDPDSFKEHRSTMEKGGLIDYTATNSFGGPVRAVFRCTTLQNITSS